MQLCYYATMLLNLVYIRRDMVNFSHCLFVVGFVRVVTIVGL